MATVDKYYLNLDINYNQLLNPLMHLVTSFPKIAKEGQFCYLLSDYGKNKGNTPYYYNGKEWTTFGTSNSVSNITTNNSYISIISNSNETNISIKPQDKNLFLASPLNSTGNTLFRAIDILDLPDLSDLYIKNQIDSIQDSNFWITSGIFNEYIEIKDSNIIETTNKLYSIGGVLYWNGSPIQSYGYRSVANEQGVLQFEANQPDEQLRFGAGDGLIVSFDASTNKIKYSVASDITVTTTNYYYYEFSLPENVYNTNYYFYSFSKSSTANNLIRSNTPVGIANADTAVPIITPFTGIISKAILQIKGAGVQEGYVEYPVYYKCKISKVGYTFSGTQYSCDFPIDSGYAVATYAPGETNAKIEINNLNISVNKGDMISLMFDPTTNPYGPASTVGHMRNAYVTLILSDSNLP